MLEVTNISYLLKKRELLTGIDFTAKGGQLIAVLGPNGAGKSTLVKLLSKELAPTAGEICWNGRNLTTYKEPEMARQRAVLTQNIYMSNDFPGKEVVLMGRYPYFDHSPAATDWQVVEQVMQRTGTKPFADRNYLSLSGGEKQRLQLGRSLAQAHVSETENPGKLLLLDEPLNNLDIKHQHSCMQIARNYAFQGNIVIVVMHDLNLAALFADRILLLKNGRQRAFGTPKEVLKEGLLSEIYDLPVRVLEHPFHYCPAVYFGCTSRKPIAESEAVFADQG